jgi:membrane protein insertase Oxa1/YidC/SpoIIIJ
MPLWNEIVEILRESIFAYAQVCNGSLGTGILAVTFLARLALMPLGIRIARAAAHQQEVIAKLRPGDSKRLAEETRRLLDREGVSPFRLAGGPGGAAQILVVIALYSAVREASASGGRFLWIRNIAKPDWPLVLVATILTVLAGATGSVPGSHYRSVMLGISAAVTLVALTKLSAGVGLYWAMSSLFGAVQGWAVQRGLRHHAA